MSRAETIFSIRYSDGGQVERYSDYDQAVDAVQSRYPDAQIGHDGDIRDGGHRTLFWASEQDAESDDGARALGSIVVGLAEVRS